MSFTPKRNLSPVCHHSPSSPPNSRHLLIHFLSLSVYFLFTCHINGISRYVVFRVWLHVFEICPSGVSWYFVPFYGHVCLQNTRGDSVVSCWRQLYMYACESESVSHSVVSDSLRLHGPEPTRLLCPWNSSDKNTGVGSHSLLQGIFWTQEWNSGLLHCRQILYHLSHRGSHQGI